MKLLEVKNMRGMAFSLIALVVFTVACPLTQALTEREVDDWLSSGLQQSGMDAEAQAEARDEFWNRAREWHILDWPKSTKVIEDFDARSTLRNALSEKLDLKAESDGGLRLQWQTKDGLHGVLTVALFETPELSQLEMLNLMREGGDVLVSPPDFQDAIIVQGRRMVAMSYMNVFLRLSYYQRKQEEANWNEDLPGRLKAILRTFYRELRKMPHVQPGKKELLSLSLADTEIKKGKEAEVRLELSSQFEGHHLRLENKNDLQNHGLTKVTALKQGGLLLNITPKEAGELSLRLRASGPKGQVHRDIAVLRVADDQPR